MDEKTIEQIKKNLNALKDYAETFPENAGWRWASESVDKTLALFDPKEEKVDDGFDMPPKAESKAEAEPEITEQMESDLIAGAVEEEKEEKPEPEPSTPLPEPSGTDSEKERMTKKEEE